MARGIDLVLFQHWVVSHTLFPHTVVIQLAFFNSPLCVYFIPKRELRPTLKSTMPGPLNLDFTQSFIMAICFGGDGLDGARVDPPLLTAEIPGLEPMDEGLFADPPPAALESSGCARCLFPIPPPPVKFRVPIGFRAFPPVPAKDPGGPDLLTPARAGDPRGIRASKSSAAIRLPPLPLELDPDAELLPRPEVACCMAEERSSRGPRCEAPLRLGELMIASSLGEEFVKEGGVVQIKAVRRLLGRLSKRVEGNGRPMRCESRWFPESLRYGSPQVRRVGRVCVLELG